MSVATDRHDRILRTCPACGRELRIPLQFVGQQVQCRFCNAAFVVSPEAAVEPSEGLRFVGSGPAFEIVRSWTGAPDEDRRSTFLRHPTKQSLREFVVAAECYGPGVLFLGGLETDTGQPVSLAKVKPGEARIVPLVNVYHAYFWVKRGQRTRARLIVARIPETARP